MPESAGHRVGFSVTGGREAKAVKIRAVIEAARGPLTSSDRILDVGTGSGGIAAALGAQATVYATDKTDQRTEKDGYTFVLADESLPFADGTFDVVISNHVIEHVADASRHLAEIRRVIKPSGVCYLATPNRWWPYEVHSRRALLHWLPPALFNRVAARYGHLDEPIVLLSLRQLWRRCHELFIVEIWHDQIIREPFRYALTVPQWAMTILKLLPQPAVRWSRAWQPTLIVVLRPTG